jgi:hypothetical protein
MGTKAKPRRFFRSGLKLISRIRNGADGVPAKPMTVAAIGETCGVGSVRVSMAC